LARFLGLILIASLVVVMAETGCSRKRMKDGYPESSKDKTISVAGDDAEMNAAIEKARSTLPVFWKTFDKPMNGEYAFSLKVKITDANGIEHFWVDKIERNAGKIFANVGNDPNTVKSVKFGQRIEVLEADITDWMFLRNGKIVGNYTIRPLLKSMPKEKADKVKEKLEEP
jgi:uncharacterized protein YegJ (DUF2314 family)